MPEMAGEPTAGSTGNSAHAAKTGAPVRSPLSGADGDLEDEKRMSGVRPKTPDGRSKRPGTRRSFLHDLMLTMGAEAGAVLSGVLLTSLVGRWAGSRSLSEYLLLRRVLSWLLAGTMVGLTAGLPRYVAQAASSGEEDEQGYFLAASICLIGTATLAGGVLILARRGFARWFFGNPQETGLVIALAMLLFGYAIHRSVGGYYRGLLEMVQANVLEMLNAVLLPLAVVLSLIHGQHIGTMMAIIGAAMSIVAALFSVPLLYRLRWRAALRTVAPYSRELMRYGLPRIPGEFGAATAMALGPMLAVHYMSMTQVAPLLLGMSLLMVTGYAAGPLASLLLSKVSMMLGRNQLEEVQARMRLLIAAIMETAVFACLQLLVFAGVVVRAWVGPGFQNRMDVIRLELVGIPAYLFFIALRSTIDAASVKAYNTGNILITLAVYAVLIGGMIVLLPGDHLLVGIAGSLLTAQLLLAVLTARTFRKLYGVGIPWRRLGPSLVAAVTLGAAALAFRILAGAQVPLLAAILVETVLTSLYLAFLARRKSGWLIYMWNVGVRRRADWSIKGLKA